jgi:hypothetical protein
VECRCSILREVICHALSIGALRSASNDWIVAFVELRRPVSPNAFGDCHRWQPSERIDWLGTSHVKGGKYECVGFTLVIRFANGRDQQLRAEIPVKPLDGESFEAAHRRSAPPTPCGVGGLKTKSPCRIIVLNEAAIVPVAYFGWIERAAC